MGEVTYESARQSKSVDQSSPSAGDRRSGAPAAGAASAWAVARAPADSLAASLSRCVEQRADRAAAGAVLMRARGKTTDRKSGDSATAQHHKKASQIGGGVTKPPRLKKEKKPTRESSRLTADQLRTGGFATGAKLKHRPVGAGKPPSRGHGMWTENVTVRAPRSYANERDAQLLRHASVRLFLLLRERDIDEKEVQMMLVNDRLFAATNDCDNLQRLLEVSKTRATKLFPNGTPDAKSGSDKPAVPKRYAAKLEKTLTGERNRGPADAVLRSALKADVTSVDVTKPDAVKAAVTGAEHQRRLIFVTGGRKHAHAEQRLMDVLQTAEQLQQPAVIAGKKRPCMICYLTFAFVNEHLGGHLQYDARPGGFWAQDTVDGFIALVKESKFDLQQAKTWIESKKQELAGGALLSHVRAHVDDQGKTIGADATMTLEDAAKQHHMGKFETGYTTDSDSEAEDDPAMDLDEKTA